MERPIISFDYAIKDILRDKANFDILSGFLTELLEKPVTVQEVLESEGNPALSRLDLKAKIDDGERAYYEADKIAMGIQKSELQTAELKGEKKGLEKAVIRGYNKGFSIETIAEYSELSTEQIIKILKENGLM